MAKDMFQKRKERQNKKNETYDEKRQMLKINDLIEFNNRSTNEKLLMVIENLEYKPELIGDIQVQNIKEYLNYLYSSTRQKDKDRIELVENYINYKNTNKDR